MELALNRILIEVPISIIYSRLPMISSMISIPTTFFPAVALLNSVLRLIIAKWVVPKMRIIRRRSWMTLPITKSR